MRTLTVKGSYAGLDVEKTVLFPNEASKKELEEELVAEIEAEWGGTVEEYEVTVKESIND